ncbi:MAG: hypothetical protein JXB30_08020 [Anaerolineae bacterium]|nr:hypothetical protein [Anaerolineae bacterium]
MGALDQLYSQASLKTAANLRTIARSIQSLSQLSLPEIDAVTDLVSQVVPAGNVPGMVLSGLARLQGRHPPLGTVKRDVDLLLRGVEQVLDRVVYGAFFAGPAAVLWGYQNLLVLADKDPGSAFPDGVWQFYLEYALREDTARHANETHGFDTALRDQGIRLSATDRITAWAMASIHCLHHYPALLENEWRERVYCSTLIELARSQGNSTLDKVYADWIKLRPYSHEEDTRPNETYAAYRRRRFDEYIKKVAANIPNDLYHAWQSQIEQVEIADLPAYQRQLSILAYLQPGRYGETRVHFNLEQARLALIYRDTYFLIPVCAAGTGEPPDIEVVRAQIAGLMQRPSWVQAASLAPLAVLRRSALAEIRQKMSPDLQEAVEALRYAPIIINTETRPYHLPLALLRQAERGIGDHALTLFDAGSTVVFDQSHIFFDGTWGAALAEIMTNEALFWANHLGSLPVAAPAQVLPRMLLFGIRDADRALIEDAEKIMPEAEAETETVNLQAILSLRRLLRQRNEQIRVTVNDLLVLYRAIHAVTYEPSPEIQTELKQLRSHAGTRDTAEAVMAHLDSYRHNNPTLLIPVDASQHSPRDRLYPMAFEVPLAEIDVLSLHRDTYEAYMAFQQQPAGFEQFDLLRRTYLATLAGYGALMSRTKEIAVLGESASVGTIKLLAHLPPAIQNLLDSVPGQFDLLNDLIKGREVFSNVGAVAPTSTLTRFISAKDDNEKKTLVWGIITDARGVMRISLRDFRPHVRLLHQAGQHGLAARIAQTYLESYARGLNQWITEMRQMVSAKKYE